MKTVLGLDLGTNSIGWALIEIDHEKGIVKVMGLGSRILPMDSGEVKKYKEGGKIDSTAAQRTDKRGIRRLNERYLLRRDRLHMVLNLLETLPKHYQLEIFTNSKDEKGGQFKPNKEPKLAYLPKQIGQKAEFLFTDSYQEMLEDIGSENIKNVKGKRIPYDWTLYYLRQKALKKEISLEELAWVLLSYNQKRGYEKTEVEDMSTKENEIVEELDLRVKEVKPKIDNEGKQYYEVYLEGNDEFVYREFSDSQMTFKGDLKEIIRKSKLDEQGNVEEENTVFIIVDIYPLKINDVKYIKDDGKHKYTLTYQNGWQEVKQPRNYTFRYKNALNRPYDYIVETIYDVHGYIKTQQGKERKLREPDLSDKSSDWTLLKKKTEKEALIFNISKGYKKENGSAENFISPQIYDELKNDALSGNRTKIIGGMFQVVDRTFYRDELNQIIAIQKQFHKNLKDEKVFNECVKLLYPKNKNHRETLLKNKAAIQHLLVEDVLLYQRPLKSKKSEIGNCKYEISYWKQLEDLKGNPIERINEETGEILAKKQPIYRKVISISHPYFQEFRIWDKIHNLKLIELEKNIDGKLQTNQDVTKEYFNSEENYQKLFDKLNNQKSLNTKQFLKFCKDELGVPYNSKKENFVWNLPNDEELKGNETRVSFSTRFRRSGFTQNQFDKFLTQEKEKQLWHYLYSVSYKERTVKDLKTNKENKSAITFFNNFFNGFDIGEEVIEKVINDFVIYPKFASRYCAYSEKSLKKLLPLIRKSGKNENDSWATEQWYIKWKKSLLGRQKEILQKGKQIDFTADKVDYSKVVYTDVDIQNKELPFPKGLFNTFKSFEKIDDFKNLNLTQASYLVYGRHSELAQAKYWSSPKQIREELHQELKQHSLNNPVAEKVLLEMTQVVADIWEHYGEQKNGNIYEKGEGYEKLFDRIHLEVGRELKQSVKDKESDTQKMSGNKAQNKRIRQVLEEFLANNPYNANPNNKDHFERLKIVEEGAEHTKNTDKKFFDGKGYTKKDIEEILKKPHITKDDFEKYKLWIEQGYKSPYTNKMIKISDLFDGVKYNVDHVFPQASITNNSLSNKVVCETEVNKLKSSQTGREFISKPMEIGVYCVAHGKKVAIITEEEYVSTVKAQFSGTKRMILLSKEIPTGFTNSQLNNSRHIARKAMELLSHIVRVEGEVEYRSKNVLPVTGRITSDLKKAWRLNEVWTELVSPRYIRMNKLTQPELFKDNLEEDKSYLFGSWQTSKNGKKYFDCNLDKGLREKDEYYDIKRIDHRHHALDALIVALCTEDHVNYINNINSNAKSRDYGKQKQIEKYRKTLKGKIKFTVKNDDTKENNWRFMLPGETRQKGVENSRRETVLTKSYYFKDLESFSSNYKKMVLTALQDTVVTFKQNLRVVNKSVNRYKDGPNSYAVQDTKNGQKENWVIRRSLGKDTFYGRINLKLIKTKNLHSSLKEIYEDISTLVDKELKKKLKPLIAGSDLKSFKDKAKTEYPDNDIIELYYFTDDTKDKKKVASRESLVYSKANKFNTEKIKTITDTGIQKILLNHLKQFDTIQLYFEEAIEYFSHILEKQELEAIVSDVETEFNSIKEFIEYLKNNSYKFDKTDYKILNVFIDKVFERDFRKEKEFENKINEHPEIAFTPENIEKMNQSKELKRLNKGKNHAPIKKVRVSSGYGKQRALNPEDKESVKSKQFVVNDAGSNLYFGIYERTYTDDNGDELSERKYEDISLVDLIETLKRDKNNRYHPLPDKAFDKKKNEFSRLFTLSPLDLVFVPTEEEVESSSFVNFNKLTKEQVGRVYKYVSGSDGEAYFTPYNISKPIWKFHGDKNKKIHKELEKEGKITITEKELIQNEIGVGSQQDKNQNMLDGKTQVKKICWKLKVDRLGNITGVIK